MPKWVPEIIGWRRINEYPFYLYHQRLTMITPNETISDKKIIKTRILRQSIDRLWWRWSSHDGLKTFFGTNNHLEFYPGGAFEIYFLPEAPEGQRGSEGCRVLSYLPNDFISFSWNVPPRFTELRAQGKKTWVVVQFLSLSANETQLTLTHLGWPVDEAWDAVYDYFQKAWDDILNQLSKQDDPAETLTGIDKKVTGIGGIFFKSKNPEALMHWYKTHLGLDVNAYGANFEWRVASNPAILGSTQWSTFPDTSTYFEPSQREFMINYRVNNLDALAQELAHAGVVICDRIESYDYGKFLHIMDMEGNKIELWEP